MVKPGHSRLTTARVLLLNRLESLMISPILSANDMTRAWSHDHFQPEMGLLGTADRQALKKSNLTRVCYF
jgi:hypothetical protein